MKTLKLSAFALLTASASAHAAFTLPPPDPAYSGVDGDFVTYSLPLLQYVVEGDDNLQSGDTFYIKSTPGEISKDGQYVVIGTFPNAAQDNGDVSPNMDDAYELINGGSANSVAFSTVDSVHQDVDLSNDDDANNAGSDDATDGLPDPGGAGQFTGDLQDSWDSNLGDLVGFTGSTDLIALFNFNEANSDNTLFGTQFLQTWVRAWITDANTGALVGEWYMTGPDSDNTARNPLGPDPSDFDGDGDPLEDAELLDDRTDWVNAFGQVCIDPTSGLSNPGCDPDFDVLNPAYDETQEIAFNHNLGADNAAYAITSPSMNAFIAGLGIANLSNYVLHIDWRLRFADNGYEQAFFVSSEHVPTPEPATLGLVGAGLLLAGGAWARRKGKAPQA